MWRQLWRLSLCLCIGLAGCKKSNDEAGGRAAAEAVLHPVVLPSLEGLQDSSRIQLQAQYALLPSLADGRQPADTAGDAYGTMGQLLLAYGLYDAAEPALLNAAELRPDDARWPYYLGHLYQNQGQPEAAAARYERVLALAPKDVPAHVHLASVYRDLGRDRDAGALLKKALRLDPRCAAAHYLLGQLAGPDETAEAIRHYEAVLRLQPAASIVQNALGLAYRRQGDLERSRQHLARRGDRNVFLDDPLLRQLEDLKKGTNVKLTRGSRLASAGQVQEAVLLFEQVVAEDSENVEGYMHLGTAQARLGRADEAIQTLEQALRLDPSKHKAHYFLGVLYGGKGDQANALEHLRAAVAGDPNDKDAHFALATTLARTRRCREAIPHFVTFLEANPGDTKTRISTAICHVQIGQYTEARALLEAGYEAAPDQPGLQDALVRVLAASPDARARDGRRALEIAQRLVTALPRPETMESLAMAYAEVGRFAEAVAQQQAAIRIAEQGGYGVLAGPMKDNLRRYEQGQPCRQPWPAFVPGQ